jgi:hypothetical protein
VILYSTNPAATAPDDGSAVALVRSMTLERLGENGLSDDVDLRRYVRMANERIWTKAQLLNPDRFLQRGPDVVYPHAGPLPFSVLEGGDPLLAGALALSLGSQETATIDYVEVKRVSDGRYFPVFPTEGRERFRSEPRFGNVLPADVDLPYEWYIEGTGIYFTPPPVMDLTCRFVTASIIPEVQDSEQLLWGRYRNHHSLVCIKAAMLVEHKDERGSTSWDGEYKEGLDLLERELYRGGTSMRTRRVNARSPF